MKRSVNVQFLSLVAGAAVMIMIISCATPPTIREGRRFDQRSWVVDYEETIKINTEPPGCRVYVQDDYKGTSPLEIRLSGGKIKVLEPGSYPAKFTNIYNDDMVQGKEVGVYTSGRNGGIERLGETTWSGSLKPSLDEREAKIVVAADGCDPETRIYKLNNQTQALRDALASLKVLDGGKLSADSAEGHSSMLIVLKPRGSGGTAYQSPMTQQSDTGRAAAQAEYDSALQAYNTALEKLNEAKAGQDATQMTTPINMGSGTPMGTLLGVTAPLASNQLLRDAEREVEVARQRLETAKAQLSRY